MSRPNSSKSVPPDGGWGWVIVFATCLIMFAYTSVTYCFGMVYVYLVEEGYSNTQVAIIPAIMNGISNLLAPISTGLTKYYSHRRVVAVGILALATGLLLCSFYNHIVWFYLCYGVIIGLGIALVKPQGVLLGQQYFQKKRTTANGFSMVGMSIGLMTLPIIISYFAQEYSYQGAFLLWSGIVLHGVIGASLYQPVKWHMKYESSIPQNKLDTPQRNGHSQISQSNNNADCSSKRNDECEKESLVTNGKRNSNSKASSDSEDSITDLSRNRRSFIDPLNTPKLSISLDKSRAGKSYSNVDNLNTNELSKEKRHRTTSYSSIASNILSGHDIIEEFGSCASFMTKNETNDKCTTENGRQTQDEEQDEFCLCCYIKLPKIKNMIKLSLLKHPAFIICTLSSIANRIVYLCFITYLPAIAKEKEIGKLAPFLLSCIAIFELLAKIVMSIISDCGWMPRRYFYIMSSFLSSISILSITVTNGFWGLAICCCCYGFCIGTAMALGNVLLVEYLGVKLLPDAFGLLLFMNGIAGIILFCVTGFLNDIAGNYLVTYCTIGGLVLMPGVLWSTINCFKTDKPGECNSPE